MTTVTVHGEHFQGPGYAAPTAIHLGPTDGPTNVTEIVVISDKILTCKLPSKDPAWPDSVGMWITTPYGVGHRPNAFLFTAPNPLAITSISPVHGNFRGGTTTVINGTGFTDATVVLFDCFGDLSSMQSFVVDSDKKITAVTPGGTLFAPYGLRIQRADGAEVAFKCGDSVGAWSFDPDPEVEVSAMSPDHGSWAGGYTVTVHGTGFISLGLDSIQINAVGLASTVVNETTATFVMPDPATVFFGPYQSDGSNPLGAVPVVLYQGGNPVATLYFKMEPLQILEATPSAARVSGGTTIVIRGTSLDTLSDIVVVDDVNAASYSCAITPIDNEHASFVFPAMAANAQGRITVVGTDMGGGASDGLVEGGGDVFFAAYASYFSLPFDFVP